MQDYAGSDRGTNQPTAPLWLQARAVANETAFNALDVEDGSFVRFRELSLTYTLPQSVVRALRTHSLSVTAAVRNLALWTRYTGADPEVSNTNGANITYTPSSNSNIVNNDLRGDGGAVPLPRYWVVRINAGL
jgi:TonB-dependent starch-binding outer membrane protein SusC